MIGTSRLIPRTLALRAVQRQTAASRLLRFPSNEQQGVFGGFPRFKLIKPSTLAQTPSLSVSIGHLPLDGLGVGLGGLGVGFGGLGVTHGGFGAGGQVLHDVARVKKRRLIVKKRASEFVLLKAIVLSSNPF